jgi:predicted enzyme related to lactoylglutathione lyase
VEAMAAAQEIIMSAVHLSSVALRVHNMASMAAFYHEALGVEFKTVETLGLESKFGDFKGLTLKLVPIRDAVDFENYPVHQLGFKVPDISKVIEAVITHGGRAEGEIMEKDGKFQAAVRDPDGNTLELYSE